MKSPNRIRAVSLGISLLYLFLSIVCAFAFLWELSRVTDWYSPSIEWTNMILFPICFLFLFPLSVWRLIHPVYLSDRGVECCRFGRVIRLIPWEQIDEVRIVREFPISMKTSAQRCIHIIPKSCEDTSPVRIDQSDHICQFIEAHYGEILDLSHM